MGEADVRIEKPSTICISGALAAGKTTLIRRLADRLGTEAVLIFDEYEAFAEWPADFDRWIAGGADPAAVSVPRLKQDLEHLLAGEAIEHPIHGRPIRSSERILIEEPFGRARPELRGLVDRLVYVDLPPDVSAIRMIERAIAPDGATPIAALDRNGLLDRLAAAKRWTNHYMRLRWIYPHFEARLRADADLILDGMSPIDDLVEAAIRWIR